MTHLSNGFPVLGISRVDVSYPFRAPIVFFDDFVQAGYGEFSGTAYAAKWRVAGTNPEVIPQASNTGAVQNVVADGGKLRVTTCSASGDCIAFSPYAGFATATYNPTDPRPIVFQCRMNMASISSCSIACGVTVAAGINSTTEPIGSAVNGAYFTVVNGAVNFQYKTSAATGALTALTDPDTSVALTIGAAVDTTFTIRYDGISTLEWWVNGKKYKSITLASFTTQVWIPFAEVKTTTGAAKFMDVDYMYLGYQEASTGRT